MPKPIKFYSMALSGHAHRVELLLNALGLEFEAIPVDLRAKEQKTEAFMRLNPFGQIPVIDDNGTIIWDSTAILTYLCLTYDPKGLFLPRDPVLFAQVMAWLGKAAGPVAYGLAAARRINLFGTPQDIHFAQTVGGDFLNTLNAQLQDRAWLVGEHLTIADMACYAYIAHAPEGGIDLKPYENIEAWIARFEAKPFFKAMPKSPVGLWAK